MFDGINLNKVNSISTGGCVLDWCFVKFMGGSLVMCFLCPVVASVWGCILVLFFEVGVL